ncbi:MAG: DUF5011 domain-containing protein, partial [Clostridia bacterium]|nr:DUF5011 domain-containing protein [Clostridia bacterium]
MSNFIQNQKQKVIAMIITVIIAVTGIPVVLFAATDTTVPVIVTNVKAGRVKAGTELSFNVTDDSPILAIYYQWDKNIDANSQRQIQRLSGEPTSYNFKIVVPFSDDLGLHEFSIAAVDKYMNVTSWITIPYYVVGEDVAPGYTDKEPPQIISGEGDEYPTSGSTIPQGKTLKIRMEDENGIYWLGYKWVREKTMDYATGATFVYKPGNNFTFVAPQETGEWYIQFYAVDGANNMTTGRWSRYIVADQVAPVLTLNGAETMDVPLNGTFNDPGASWTDNTDGTGIVYANEQLDTSKVGPQTLTYTYTDKGGNVSNTVSRIVTVVGTRNTYKLTPPSKVDYLVKEEIDLTGAQVEVTDTRGNVSYVEPTLEMFEGFSTSKPGSFSVPFKYEEGIVLYRYNVKDFISNVSIESMPTKTEYRLGEKLDLTGGKIKVTMASGAIEEIDMTDDMIKQYDETFIGEQKVIITYNETELEIPITIRKKEMTTKQLDISIPEEKDLIYDGTPKTVAVKAVEGISGIGEITVKYYPIIDGVEGEPTTEAPVNSGEYRVKVDVAEGQEYEAKEGLVVGTIIIRKAEQTTPAITLSKDSVMMTEEAPDLTLSNSVMENGTVTFTSSDEKVVTVDENGNITLVGAGKAEITVTYGETTNYTEKSATVTLEVTRDTLVENNFIIENPTTIYDTMVKDAKVTVDVDGIGTLSVVYKQNGSVVTPINAGKYDVYVNVTEGTKYGAVTDLKVGTLTINKAEQTTPAITLSKNTVMMTEEAPELTLTNTAMENGKVSYVSSDENVV